jgi:hypothetical protein
MLCVSAVHCRAGRLCDCANASRAESWDEPDTHTPTDTPRAMGLHQTKGRNVPIQATDIPMHTHACPRLHAPLFVYRGGGRALSALA